MDEFVTKEGSNQDSENMAIIIYKASVIESDTKETSNDVDSDINEKIDGIESDTKETSNDVDSDISEKIDEIESDTKETSNDVELCINKMAGSIESKIVESSKHISKLIGEIEEYIEARETSDFLAPVLEIIKLYEIYEHMCSSITEDVNNSSCAKDLKKFKFFKNNLETSLGMCNVTIWPRANIGDSIDMGTMEVMPYTVPTENNDLNGKIGEVLSNHTYLYKGRVITKQRVVPYASNELVQDNIVTIIES